ncbi:hypothetical protein FOMPIDRAFT_1021495 [Fomitopsis schrenkii]|uniref:Uncharacterized protein n=1 Tax=Fomitopsis schrenkii TaxID=2126942 RepID=S8ELW9_FOMSC|nr:hypothetical protein FOMPIDRAFT_1021495 [Fomitopsis schrenkii]
MWVSRRLGEHPRTIRGLSSRRWSPVLWVPSIVDICEDVVISREPDRAHRPLLCCGTSRRLYHCIGRVCKTWYSSGGDHNGRPVESLPFTRRRRPGVMTTYAVVSGRGSERDMDAGVREVCLDLRRMSRPSAEMRLVATQCGLVRLDYVLRDCETSFPGFSRAA